MVELVDNVATVTLNDPATLNAASIAMARALKDELDRAVHDGARAVILTGAGRGFCSGGNLSEDFDPESADYDAGASLDWIYHALMRTIRDLPIPLVTAVNGAAAGIGCALALMGDIIVASERAFFLQAFRHIGLVPDGGTAHLLVQAAGRVRAMEMMLLGERIPAAKAYDWGLISRVVDHERLLPEAMAIATNLACGPTVALRGIREQCWLATESTFEDLLALERCQQRNAGRTADHAEGVAAFLAKRPPRFRGH